MKTGPKPRPLAERLWAKVDRRGPDECWPWLGVRRAKGYGLIARGGNSARYGHYGTHVAAYMVTFGPVPSGMVVRHSCDNPPCCNPHHLILGTTADNQRDSRERGRAHFQNTVRDSKGRFTPAVTWEWEDE